MTTDTLAVGHNESVKYNNVLANLGDGYNNHTGQFTAPYSGIYIMSASIMAQPTNELNFKIVKNGQMLSRIFSNKDTFPLASQTFNLPLQKGDQIWVQGDVGRELHSYPAGPYNIFSGALINVL